MGEYLLYGISLGLAAGIAPGPLLVLVISETIRGNRLNGITIAVSPLVTDLPIILISIFLLKSLSSTASILGVLSILGGLFLVYIGIQNIKFKPPSEKARSNYNHSLKYGIITNLLSPHPYLFWISIGAPMFIKSGSEFNTLFIAFLIGFYCFLIGSKIGVALISEKVKGFVQSSTYKYIMKFMGLVLLILAIFLMVDGFNLLYPER